MEGFATWTKLKTNKGQIAKQVKYYEGYYKDGKMDGYGYEITIEGMAERSQYVYRGQFKDGKKNGYGEYMNIDGEMYIG